MLTPNELRELPEHIVQNYQDLEDQIIADISRRISKTGAITETAEFQIASLNDMGLSLDEIERKISQTSTISEAELRNLFQNSVDTSMSRDNNIYERGGFGRIELKDSPAIMQFMNAQYKKTAGDLSNLTKSLGFAEVINGKTVFKPIAQFYQETLNYAQFQIASGAFDYNTVIKQAVKKMADSGIRTVDYKTGWSNRLDVATRRAVLTGIHQTAGQISLMHANMLGSDIMELTAHAGARPSHVTWQGQLVSLSGQIGYLNLNDIGYGEVTGFKGANCRHDWNPFIPGVSVRNYTDEELANIDPPPFEYKGKTYTAYEASQKQRQIETGIRKTKREMIAYDAAGLKTDFTYTSVKLQRQKALYKDFSNAAGLRMKPERHQVYKFNKSVSQKGVWQVRKNNNGITVNEMYNKGNSEANFKKAFEKALSHGEKTGNECLLWLNLNGEEVVKVATGNKNSVALSQETINYLLSAKKNTVISIHNHPSSSAFSPEDMNVACKFNSIKEMRVVGHDGTKYYLEIGTGDRPSLEQIQDDYNKVKDAMQGKYQDIFDKTGDSTSTWKEHSNEINELISMKFKWKYRREIE